jgi:beta-xylosidase
VLGRPDGYVLYYAVRHRAAGRQCLSLATASRPEGPFVDTSAAPFVFQDDRGGSIDPSPFVDGDGTAYLFWKSDDNALGDPPNPGALGRPTSLWGARLSADGLTLTEAPVEVLRQDQPWEAPAIEAPSLVFASGAYYLFYSAGPWESASYCVAYATGDAPLGPFRKESPRPWMTSRQEAAGPGGAEVFTDASGSLRIAYHAWTPPNIGYGAGGVRSLWIDRLRFVGGRPVLDESTTPQSG